MLDYFISFLYNIYINFGKDFLFMKNKIFRNYNKKILLFFLYFVFSLALSAQSSASKYKWYSPKEIIQNMDKLQSGDILVLSKGSSFRTMWGHAAILNEHKKIVELPT